jgi:hypothetical protein
LIIPQDFLCIREYTLERNHINVRTVTSPSINAHFLEIIKESILKKNYTNIKTVTNPSVTTQPSETTREFTLEKKHTNVRTDKSFSQGSIL